MDTGMELIVDPRVDEIMIYFKIKNKVLKMICCNEYCREEINIEQDWDDLITGGECEICDSLLTFSPGIPIEMLGPCEIKELKE